MLCNLDLVSGYPQESKLYSIERLAQQRRKSWRTAISTDKAGVLQERVQSEARCCRHMHHAPSDQAGLGLNGARTCRNAAWTSTAFAKVGRAQTVSLPVMIKLARKLQAQCQK